MNVLNYNIEFAHVYANNLREQIFSKEFEEGISQTKRTMDFLESRGRNFSLNVLIDDYSTRSEANIPLIIRRIKELGVSPDYIMLESSLTRHAEDLISKLPPKFILCENNRTTLSTYTDEVLLRMAEQPLEHGDKIEYSLLFLDEHSALIDKQLPLRFDFHSDITLKYEADGEKKYTCSVLTACWHLMRLNVKPFSTLAESLIPVSNMPFFGERIITILPVRYLRIETIALDLISLSKTKTISKKRKYMEYHFFSGKGG